MASHGRGEDNAPRRDRVQVVFVLSPKSWVFELLQIWQIAGRKEAVHTADQQAPATPAIPARECILVCLPRCKSTSLILLFNTC